MLDISNLNHSDRGYKLLRTVMFDCRLLTFAIESALIIVVDSPQYFGRQLSSVNFVWFLFFTHPLRAGGGATCCFFPTKNICFY